ncbi:MAG: hypothetical protein WBM46_16295 [Polyangiales bacterium]
MLNGDFGGNLEDEEYEIGDRDEEGGKPKRPGLPVEPRRVISILVQNRRPLLRAFLIASIMAAVASFFVPRTFESSAQLLFEGTPVLDQAGGQSALGAFAQSAIMPGRLREIRQRLGWNVSLDEVESQIEVALAGEDAMRITAHARTPEEAQALAKAVLDVFLARQASFNAERLALLTTENQAALERARERREEANQAYEAFREKSGRPDLLQEREQLIARAAELRSKVDEAVVEVASQQARISELKDAVRELPQQVVASATKGSPVDSPLAQARADLAAARASLSDQHPRVQALKERVASLQAQRKGEKSELADRTLTANPARGAADQALVTARAAHAAAMERESALRVLLKATENEAASLASEQGEARQIIGELEMATARVEELTKRAATFADAAVGPMTGFRVLSVPMLPEGPQRSKMHVVLLMAFPVVAVLIFALVILVRRLKELTVEAPREVAWWGNGPVLGTSVWPRDPAALEPFVDELEDYGANGAGRTLVVPASEAERDIACAFAMRLSEAPWLAAAILDVGARAGDYDISPLVTPPPSSNAPDASVRPRRLSSQGIPSVAAGRVIVTPESKPPSHPTIQGLVPPVADDTPSSRPPRKSTVIGMPAVQSSFATEIFTEPPAPPSQASLPETTKPTEEPEAFRRRPGARATVRMIVPVAHGELAADAAGERGARVEEEAFLLTRPVPVATDRTPTGFDRTAHAGVEPSATNASGAVMRAAIRLLGNDEDDVTSLRRSTPPVERASGGVTGVALAWNGPLSGPLLRRAARLAHRVMVVVSSGMSVIDLARVRTRLGRDEGVGYVLVNVGQTYVDLPDRVGPVEEFWQAAGARETEDARLP